MRVTVLSVLVLACAAPQGAGGPRRYFIDTVRAQCIPFTDVAADAAGRAGYRACAVSGFGDMGVVDGMAYHYAMYCLIPAYADSAAGTSCGGDSFNAQYHWARGVIVFAGDSGRSDVDVAFERVSAEVGNYIYRAPSIERTDAGTMLYLPIAVDGTGNYNASEYYLRADGEWRRIEAEGWLVELRARLPPGRAIWKGVWPDPRTLRAEAGLYREGDGNCCPTGGTARIQLAIRDARFELVSVEFDPAR